LRSGGWMWPNRRTMFSGWCWKCSSSDISSSPAT